ncbi:3-deoxy-D-manno-octulosonic acid transferase [Agarivorans sp. TSD2052]|uniref:3-deoxy-D-manno-octulosonic acid transferase n=1 Tax=Agarivorans sp. TSD2052 TaxID=2937286 RepID=UPI00200E8254|nr:3-deoxy-D-manno-octulosonic acid transferase [Agarivorans sp. TSD2052]UPW18554.1 3-deoxy-D-manno-octulosonic acid transferase [Agarivorans sp. TSD2052]
MNSTVSLHQTLEKHFNSIYWLVFLSAVALSLIYASNQILTGDQTQMLIKGYLGAYQNNWLSYGNAASVVGNVPGSLSTYIVGIPLLIWNSAWAPMLLLLALRVVSFLLFDLVIKQIFSPVVRLSFLVLYLLNPWFLFDSLIYNPAYLCFFAALHCWSAFNMSQQRSFIFSFLNVIAIGFAMQLHYSWPILAVMSAYLFYRRLIHVHWLGIIFGCATIFVSLIPYLIELQANQAIQGQESDRYIGWGGVHVYPVFKSVLYWLRYSSFLFSNRIITDAEFLWLTDINWLRMAINYLWQAVLYVVGGLTVIVSWGINQRVWRRIKPHWRSRKALNLSNQDWLMHYAFSAVLGIIISAILSPIIFSYWHLIITFGFALFPVLYQAQRWQNSQPERLAKIIMLVAGYFLVVNLVASHDSNKFSYTHSFAEQERQFLIDKGLAVQSPLDTIR